MKSELIALDSICFEVEWLKDLLFKILLISSSIPPILVHCDSKTTIDVCKKKLINSKISRHIKVR